MQTFGFHLTLFIKRSKSAYKDKYSFRIGFHLTLFIKCSKSAYKDKYSFRIVHSQLDVLALSEGCIVDDCHQHSGCLVQCNPLHLPDFWLAGIETTSNRMCDNYNSFAVYIIIRRLCSLPPCM